MVQRVVRSNARNRLLANSAFFFLIVSAAPAPVIDPFQELMVSVQADSDYRLLLHQMTIDAL
jgi:hypothetical protein